MTNYHVVEPILARDRNSGYTGPRGKPKSALCRSDYFVMPNNRINSGSVFRLADDWCVLLRPNSLGAKEPLEGELDCAIVRLAKPAGELAVGDHPVAGGAPRGWLKLPDAHPMRFVPDRPLFIVQHPQSHPIKLAMENKATVGNSVAEGWAGALLQAVHFDRSENEPLKVFFAAHGHLNPGRNPHWNDPWQSTRLVGQQFFMCRSQIRNRLRLMDSGPNDKKVMVISSEKRQVGKTHTCLLVKFVRPESNHKLTYLDVDERRYDNIKTRTTTCAQSPSS